MLKLWATAFAIVGAVLVFTSITVKYNIDWGKLVLTIIAGIVLAYGLALILVGSTKLHRFFIKTVEWIFGIPGTE